MIAILISLFIMIALWGAFFLSFHFDRSRYLNCHLLFWANASVIPFLIIISGEYSDIAIDVILYSLLFSVLLVPFLLFFNGFVMIKREGSSLSHILSLILGVIILYGDIALFIDIVSDMMHFGTENITILYYAIIFVVVSVFYFAVSVLVFITYTAYLQIIPVSKNSNYIIVLGAGLIDGEKVSKLLSDRIDKGISIYKSSSNNPKFIVSGGKGSDEKISEAEAMKRYLLEKGIPETDIILEDKSTTTYENIANSKKILDEIDGEKKVVVVSNNYHVYRALRYCKKIGLKSTGAGGHTAFYFWPSAVIREYIAIHAEKKNTIIFFIGWVLSIVAVLLFLS